MAETTAQPIAARLNWRNLLRLAIAGDIAVLLYMVLALQDTLALGLIVGFLIALGLLRLRSGILGLLLIGLLSADVAFWTVSGAVSNFVSGERLSALVLPAYLGLFSLTGLAAAIAVWITRQDPARGAGTAGRIGQALLALLLLITVSGLLVRQRPPEARQPTDLELSTKNMEFSRSELVSQNSQVTVQLTNHDLWWHTFTIDELGVDLRVPMGAERAVTFSAPPGNYRFYCSIPGHASSMNGTLTITDGR